jgi:hypothetical protein
MGSLATYGFIVAYGLVSIALPRYLREHGFASGQHEPFPLSLSWRCWLALVGNLYPVPEGPYGKLPYVYLAYLAAGMIWLLLRGNRKALETSRN